MQAATNLQPHMISRISKFVLYSRSSLVRWRMRACYIAIIAGHFATEVPLVSEAKAETFTLGASQDAMAYSFTFVANSALESTYPNFIAAANTGASNHYMSGFLQFDLAPLMLESLVSDDILSATMRLYVLPGSESGFGAGGPSATYPTTVDVRLLESSWNEATITWNNQPGGAYNPTVTQPTGTAVVATSPSILDSGVWVDFNMTDVVQGWLDDPTSNYGLRLTQTSSVRDAGNAAVFPTFASSEHSTESYRPQLLVQTVPEPGTALLLGLGAVGFLSVRRRKM